MTQNEKSVFRKKLTVQEPLIKNETNFIQYVDTYCVLMLTRELNQAFSRFYKIFYHTILIIFSFSDFIKVL